MRSYPFLNDLFTNVLAKSKAVQGRFFICPQFGREMNADDLNQVITDTVKEIPGRKYPLVLMMPPVSHGTFGSKKDDWEDFNITLFFLNTTYYTGNNQVKAPNPHTQTSTHTIMQDWHDMKRCGVSFARVLDQLQRTPGVNNQFRLASNVDKVFRPISNIGADRASGVRLDFAASLFIGCEMEDYNPDDINSITMPVADSHPEHKL